MTDPVRRFLKPVEGGRVRKPDKSVLKDEGEWVVMDTYWQRRLDHDDVVETDPPKATKQKDDA